MTRTIMQLKALIRSNLLCRLSMLGLWRRLEAAIAVPRIRYTVIMLSEELPRSLYRSMY